MDVMSGAYVPGDTQLVQQLVYELKSQGIFDQFRRECIADVDTKPAYQNLRQRVEGSVSSFLKGQHWNPAMNKNQVREQLRKNIYEIGFLDTGVERIVDQVVNPKINTVFLPKVEEVVYKFLGVKRPDKEAKREPTEAADLMPTDLEAVSPGSVHSFKAEEEIVKKEDAASLDDSVNSKVDDDESPPFEPLENNQEPTKQSVNAPEDNSVDSCMSGFSGLQSHDSNNASDKKPNWPGQESQSCNGSDSQFSTVASDEVKMEICEDSNSKSEEYKKGEGEVKTEVDSNKHKEEPRKDTEAVEEKRKSDDDGKSKSSHSSSSKDKKDSKHRKDHDRSRSRSERDGDKSKHSSSSSSRNKHSRSSSSTKEKDKSKQDKEKDADKHKKKSSKDNDRSKEDKERKDKDKSTREKEKSKEKSKSDKDKEKSRKDRDKPKEKGERDRDKSSSRNEDKEKSSSKSEDREKSSSKSEAKEKLHVKNEGQDKDKSSSKDDKDKSKSKDSSRHKSSSNGKHSSRDKDRSSSSSSSKKKDDNSHKSKSGKDHKHDPKKSTKDDHYSFKDKNGSRRSFDRDSNDGSSSNKPKHKADPFSELPKSVQNSSTTSSFYGSGDSGNSDQVEKRGGEAGGGEAVDGQVLKLLKPKFASNFEEARKLMKIRKHLTMLERHNKLSLTQIDNVSSDRKEVKVEESLEEAELCTPQIAHVSKENWEALEAKLALEMSKTVNCSSYESHYDVPDEGTTRQEDVKKEEEKVVPEDTTEEAKVCDVEKKEEVKTEAVPALALESKGDIVEDQVSDVIPKDKIENGKLPHDTPKDSAEKQNISVSEVEPKEIIELDIEMKTSNEQDEELINDRNSPVKMELCVRLEELGDNPEESAGQQVKTETSEDKHADSSDDERCRYLEMPSPELYRRLNFLVEYVAKLQVDMEPPVNNLSPPLKRGKKRSNENVDMTNNNKEVKPEKRLRRKANSTGNKVCRTSSTEVSLDQNFFLPDLSPAERDKPSQKKDNVLLSPPSQEKRPRNQSKRQQHYTSEDLYKPRPTIGLRRSRSSTNNT